MLSFFFLYQVYQRADLNKMLMSMSVGPYCDLNQDVDSKDYKHGAVVSLEMDENERECKLHIYTNNTNCVLVHLNQ